MKELTLNEIESIAGGIDSGQASLGATLLGVATALAIATPIGALTITAVASASYLGGFFLANGLANDGDTRWLNEQL